MSAPFRIAAAFAMIWALLLSASGAALAAPNATALVQAALDNWRGNSSYSSIEMTIRRPGWQRQLALVGWTRGKRDTLVRFTQPAADAGNATLKVGSSLWLYNPKINQVIKLPFSMMAQNWMGSDFSYNDLAKSDQVVTDYTHSLGPVTTVGGHRIYTVISLPKPAAPVVWGKLELKIRDDNVMVSETFFDQDMKPVRRLVATTIAPLGGRPYPVVMRLTPLTKPGYWTELRTLKAAFDLTLPNYLFTRSNLRNPRPWRAP